MDLSDLVGLVTATMAVVLGAAGIAKFVDPAATVATLDAIGLPGRRSVARVLGAVETGLAVWLLATGSRTAAAGAAIAYLALTVAVVVLRRRSPATPCGCFGAWSGPPTTRHLMVNSGGVVACSLAAATDAAVAPPDGSSGLVAFGWWLAVVVAAVVVVLTLTSGRSTPPATPTTSTLRTRVDNRNTNTEARK